MTGKRGERPARASFLVAGLAGAAVWLAVAASALIDRRMLRRPPPQPAADSGDGVAIIVPARNEAHNIAQWLAHARRQRAENLRIVVVDDESTDDTLATASRAAGGDARVHVAAAQPRPPGWIGKPWSAYCGATQANAPWFLFSDADVLMHPLALSTARKAACALDADALSLTSTLECSSFWERIVMPAVALLIFAAMPVWAVHSRKLRTALLAGGFMLVRSQAYWIVGGHAAVRGSIAEDRDLAERLKAFGFRVRIADGSDLVRVRMYRGLADMWRGWRKNFYEGVRRRPWAAGLAVAGSIVMFVLPLPAVLGLGLLRLRRPLRGSERTLLAANATSLAAMILARAARDPVMGIKTSLESILLSPLAGMFIAAVMAASAWRIISGRGQEWKGRRIP
jgi:chlorobactene glucosyltransferase